MCTAACTSEGLQRTDVFFSKRIMAMVSLLVSRVFSLLVKVILKVYKVTGNFKGSTRIYF